MLLIKELDKSKVGESISLAGWLRTKRDSKGGFSFLEINDGSSFKGIQVIADQNLDNYVTNNSETQESSSNNDRIVGVPTTSASDKRGGRKKKSIMTVL